MRYGVCFGVEAFDRVKTAKAAGFDFIECGFANLSRFDNSRFQSFKNALEENNILCEAANCFIPSDYRLTGNDISDKKELCEYIEKGMARGEQIGLKIVVFGSGGARNLPDGFSFKKGFLQLRDFLRDIASPIAENHGITVVTEPLRFCESNIINTVSESVMLAAATECGNIAGLADIFHMVNSGDAYDNIRRLKGEIVHSHISCPLSRDNMKRIYPSDINEFDYRGFIDALREAGCERCSVEAKCSDFEKDAFAAAAVLKAL